MDIKSGLATSEGKGAALDGIVTLLTTVVAMLTTTGVVKVDDQAMLLAAAIAIFKGIQGAIVLVMYIKSRTDIKVAEIERGGEVG